MEGKKKRSHWAKLVTVAPNSHPGVIAGVKGSRFGSDRTVQSGSDGGGWFGKLVAKIPTLTPMPS